MSVINQAKRPYDNGDDSHSQPSQKRVRMSSALTPFQAEKLSISQQLMEQLNAQYKEEMKDSSFDNARALAAEYLRVSQTIHEFCGTQSGEVMACGSDDCGALAQATYPEEAKELEYPPRLCLLEPQWKFVKVVAGGLHSMALSDDGHVMSWGQNDDMALGRKTTDADMHLAGEVELPPKARGRIVDIGAGDNQSVFLTLEGDVFICGMMKDVDSGKFCNVLPHENLFNGTRQPKPMKVPFPKPIRKIEVGISSNAAIDDEDNLYTWGMGHCGELARSAEMGAPLVKGENGQTTYELGKTFIGSVVTKMVSKKKDGKVVTVEEEEYKYDTKLILEKFLTPSPVQWQVPGKYTVLEAAMGDIHLLVVAKVNDTVKVFSSGHGFYGRLGHGDQKPRHELTEIKSLANERIHHVAAGSFHSLFLNAFGSAVYACGRSDGGQCGLYVQKEEIAGGGVLKPTPVPFPVSAKNNLITGIRAGGTHSMALMGNGDLYSWGFNDYSQTGHPCKQDGNSMDIERPKLLVPMRAYTDAPEMGTHAKVLDASCGGQHSVFLVQRGHK